jgi:hypothetical protein
MLPLGPGERALEKNPTRTFYQTRGVRTKPKPSEEPKMPYPVPGHCPVCGKEFNVTELLCKSCRVTVRGDFTLCDFCRLSSEQRAFLKHFVAVGGSIKDMESFLGISYPTVKKRLAELADVLGVGHRFPRPDPKQAAAERLRLLEMLSTGEMTAEEVSQKFEAMNEEEEG